MSALSGPPRTRKTVIRPAKGSATVLKTKAPAPGGPGLARLLGRRGYSLDNEVEKCRRPEILAGHAAGDRKEHRRARQLRAGLVRARRRGSPRLRGSAPSGPRPSRRPPRSASLGPRLPPTQRPPAQRPARSRGRPRETGTHARAARPPRLGARARVRSESAPRRSCSRAARRILSSVVAKSARSRSSMLTKSTRASPSRSERSQARPV